MVKLVYKWMGRVLAGYVAVGSVYYFSGVLPNLVKGKALVFSPFVGYPLTVLGWPHMLYADFLHRETLGIKISFPITSLSIILVVFWLINRAKREF